MTEPLTTTGVVSRGDRGRCSGDFGDLIFGSSAITGEGGFETSGSGADIIISGVKSGGVVVLISIISSCPLLRTAVLVPALFILDP